MRKLLFFGLMLVGACDSFNSVRIPVASGNQSNQNVVTLINRGSAGPQLGPGGTAQFTVKIEVATGNANGGYSTAPLDKTTTVGVSYRIVNTGQITDEVMCQAGAKLILHTTYKLIDNQYAQVNCWTSWTSQSRALDSTAHFVKISMENSDPALPDHR
jgi:hypothetical protein